MDAALELKNARHFSDALEKFAKVLSRGGPETAEEMLSRAACYSPDSIRRARVRLDIVAMNVHRRWLAELLVPGSDEVEHIDVYVYADASPSGSEGWNISR